MNQRRSTLGSLGIKEVRQFKGPTFSSTKKTELEILESNISCYEDDEVQVQSNGETIEQMNLENESFESRVKCEHPVNSKLAQNDRFLINIESLVRDHHIDRSIVDGPQSFNSGYFQNRDTSFHEKYKGPIINKEQQQLLDGKFFKQLDDYEEDIQFDQIKQTLNLTEVNRFRLGVTGEVIEKKFSQGFLNLSQFPQQRVKRNGSTSSYNSNNPLGNIADQMGQAEQNGIRFILPQSNMNINSEIFRLNGSNSPDRNNDLKSQYTFDMQGSPSLKDGKLGLSNVDYLNEKSSRVAHDTKSDLGKSEKCGLQGVWSESAFLILTLLKKFASNIKELSMKYKFGQMKRKYFELIDDKANDENFYRIRGFLKNDKPSRLQIHLYAFKAAFNKRVSLSDSVSRNSFARQLFNIIIKVNIGVLLPDSPSKILWDCLILFLLCINVFYIPMRIAFEDVQDMNPMLLIFVQDIPSWAFVMDIFLTFNTAYYSKGIINEKRSKIIKHYLKGTFVWELIIVIPFLFSSMFSVQFLNMILLFRSSKILNIVSSFEELLNLKQHQVTVMSFIKLIFTIVYIAHICGCFFYYMHVLQLAYDLESFTWVIKFNLLDSGWVSLYISSVYWAVITMITLGYGDIYPVSTIEKIYVIVVTLLSCGVFAYAVNSIGSILQEHSKKGIEFRQKMRSLINHMRKRELRQIKKNR